MNIKHQADFPVLRTERLVLRSLRESDASTMFTLRTIPENQKYLDRPPTVNEAAALLHIQRILEGIKNGIWINWAMTTLNSDELIGCIGFWNYHERLPHVHIGYEMLPAFHGKGLMSEAMQAVLRHGAQQMGIQKVTAEINGANKKSKNLLTKFDFELETSKVFDENPILECWSRAVTS